MTRFSFKHSVLCATDKSRKKRKREFQRITSHGLGVMLKRSGHIFWYDDWRA